jgi:Undecaprenyl-phosphate glucose phosphotransferase
MSEDCFGLMTGDVQGNFAVSDVNNMVHPAKTISAKLFVYAAIFLDIAAVAGIASLVDIVAYSTKLPLPDIRMSAISVFLFAILMLFKGFHLYKIEKIENFKSASGFLAGIWAVVCMVAAALAFWPKTTPNFEFFLLFSFFCTGLSLILAERFLLARIFERWVSAGLVSHVVAVIGSVELAKKFVQRVEGNRFGVKVSAIFDDLSDGPVSEMGVFASGVDGLIQHCRVRDVETVLVALPMDDSERLRNIVHRLSMHPLNIRILPGELALKSSANRYAPMGEIPGIQLMTISDRPIDTWGFLAKSCMDRVFGLLALLLFGPVMIFCAIGIKLSSPGPIFFRQKRIGYRNKIFEVYKFRSMHAASCNTGKLTERGDPRVFKFGQIMRKLSLDELPQIFNVLKGDMSLVGPRPHMPEARAAGQYYFDAVAAYGARHRVKPGITGWAQVSGWRGPTETIEQIENRVAHDLFYIDNWSLGFDILILIKTVFVGFAGKNAF